ncbi:MAG: hypothetical protein TREMPRED_005298, partial [Tremellales sp. Tagirdzhanova-0007]
MLNKPLSHIRPLLRLPAHPSPSPELFTPNPSLLHHLPQNGIGNSLVSQAQSSAQAAGNASSGAGRAGNGGGSAGAGNGGYTGHARAFLSLPQTSGNDPTSSLITDEDSRSESSTSARRSSLSFKQRLTNQTRVIGAKSADARRAARREIEGRVGHSRLALVDVEDEQDSSQSALLLEEKRASPARRRSSIAFPTRPAQSRETVLPLLAPRPRLIQTTHSGARSSHPTLISSRPNSLSRSKTSLEIWQVGIPQPHISLSVRALSTRSAPKPLPLLDPGTAVVATPPPGFSLHTWTPQRPYSVLMDLAGMDMPVSDRRGQFRRNSVSVFRDATDPDETIHGSYLDAANEDMQEDVNGSREALGPDERLDHQILEALRTASLGENARDTVRKLVAHYRSDRIASPFAPSSPTAGNTLQDSLPLPTSYSLDTYNMCLETLLRTRGRGESIALILEVYNEMLERDLVPSTKTYQYVIRALCRREVDVGAAVSEWTEARKWSKWSAETLGTEWDEEQVAEKDLIMEGYRAEGNLESAVKLFRAASLAKGSQRYHTEVYAMILELASNHPEPGLEVIIEVFRRAQRYGARARRTLYKHAFKALGSAKDLEGVKQLCAEYENTQTEDTLADAREWTNARAEDVPKSLEQRKIFLAYSRTNWSAAIQAFVIAGDTESAHNILNKMLASPLVVTDANLDATVFPHPSPKTGGDLLDALVDAGKVTEALEWYPQAGQIASAWGKAALHPNHVFHVSDALILAGRWRDAVMIVADWVQAEASSMVRRDIPRLRHLYTAVLGAAIKADPQEAVEILSHVPRF